MFIKHIVLEYLFSTALYLSECLNNELYDKSQSFRSAIKFACINFDRFGPTTEL